MEIIGFLAALLTTISFIPQVYKIFKTNNTNDLSLIMYILFNIGVSLWLIYGIHLKSFPIISANVITLFLGIYILYKIIHNLYIKNK